MAFLGGSGTTAQNNWYSISAAMGLLLSSASLLGQAVQYSWQQKQLQQALTSSWQLEGMGLSMR
jgi:hypothetical protein